MMADKIRVLYVDDEQTLLDLCKVFLERSGNFIVTTSTGAPEALRILELSKFDAIVSDYQMPEMDGIEFLKVIRGRGDKTPFVIFTGKGREEVVIDALNAGADFYIQKGGEPKSQFAELAHKIKKGVEGRQTEGALKESEHELNVLFKRMINAFVLFESVFDNNGTVVSFRFVFINDAYERITGVKNDEVRGKTLHEVWPGTEASWIKAYGDVAVTGVPSSFEMYHEPTKKLYDCNVYRPSDSKDRICVIFDDITERKASEQALTKSQNQLADAMDLAHMVSWEFDVASGIFTFNDRFYALYGTTAEREGGYQMPAEVYAREFVHPDEVSLVANEVQKAITATDPNFTRQIEHRIIRRDGKIRHIIVRFRITKDTEGITVKTHGANQDITDRIEAEESIRLSRAFLDRIIDMSPFAMWISDKEGTVVRVNRALCETINAAPDLIVGRYNVLRDVNLEKQGVMPDVKAVFEKHKQAHFTIPWKAADAGDSGLLAARDMYIDVAIFPVLDAHGNLTNVICQWVDITDRKQIEHALQESEERYRAIVEDQTELICRFTPGGRLTFVNDAYCRYFGLDRPRCIGNSHTVKLIPEDARMMKQHLASLTPQNPVATIDHRIIMPSGEVRWQRWNDRAIFDQNGNVVEYLSVGRDITEYKLAEEALQTKERQLSSIFNNVSEVLYFLSVEPDLRFRFISINKQFLDTTGLSENQVAGRYVDEVIPEPSLSLVLENFKQAIREHKTVRWFEVTPYPSGTKYGHVAITPIYDGNGRCTNLIGNVHDITDLKMAEEELRISEEKFRNVFDWANDAILLHTLTTDGAPGRFIAANLVACRMLGYSREELLTMGPPEIIPQKLHPQLGDIIRQAQTKDTVLFETWFKRKDGTTFPIESSGHLVNYKGKRIWISHIRDITERKRAEEELRESEERYREFFITSRDCVFITSPKGRWIDFNNVAIDFFGYSTREELADIPIQDLYENADTRTKFNAIIIRDGYVEDYPVRLKRKDGTVIDTLITSVPLRADNGSVKAFIGTIRDVTKQKRAEQEIRTLQQFQQSIINNANVWISVLDPKGTILLWNTTAEKISGYLAKDVIGKNTVWKQIYPDPVYRRQVEENILNIIKKNTYVENFETRIRTKNGDEKIIWWNTQPLRDASGKAIRFIAIARDNTERKKAEAALRESEELFKGVAERSSDLILLVDERGKATYVSPSVERILGYIPDEIVGKTPEDFIIPEDIKAVWEGVNKSVSGDSVGGVTVHARKKSGEYAIMEMTASPVIKEDRISGIQVIARDITERKRVEEELQVTKEKYTKAFLSVPDAITISELESGRFIEVNDAASTLFGYTRDELVNKSAIDLGIWVNKEERDAFVDQIKKEGRVVQFRVVEQRKSGELFDASITADTITIGNTRYLIAATRDISKHKQMEETLRESETRYKNIVEDQTEFISRFLPDGTHVFVNDAYCRYFGKTHEEIIGHLFVPDIPQEDRKIVRQHFQSLTPDNPVASVDHRIIMHDGSVRWQRWSDRAIFDNTGKIVEYQSVGRDITQTKQIESELKNSEHLRQDIIDHLPDPTFVINADGIVIAWNKALEALTGVNARYMVGKGNYEYAIPFYGERRPILVDIFIHPDQEGLKKYSSVQDEGETLVAETSIAYLNGKSVILWVKVSKLYAEDGRLIGAIETIRDVTDRKRMEDGLRESEERYSSIFDNNYSVSLLIDPDTGKIVEANAAAVRYYGYSHDDLTRLGIYDLNRLPKDKIVRDLQQAKHEKAKHFFSTHYLASGKKRNVEIYSGPITTQGKSYFYSIIHDITERKQAEEALALASKKLSLLSSITRHDILNQLTALRGYINLSEDMLNNPVKMREFLEKEERAAATIEEQITFTKEYQEMGVSAPLWQSVNAKLKKAQKLFLMRDVRVDVDCTDLEVYADPLFEKVFYNLIDNALRYGGDGMKAIRVHCQESNTGLVITCEDNGVGITQEDKKRLFTRGFGKHTGLGLFLTREILGITGITITENGIPGKGARFEITVPKGAYRFTSTSNKK